MSKMYQKTIPDVKTSVKCGGFTLIELLVVVLIIGILAAVALPKYQVAVAKTKTSLAIFQLAQIMQAQERYFMDTGKYSPDLEVLDITVPVSEDYTFSCGSASCYQGCTAMPKNWGKLPRIRMGPKNDPRQCANSITALLDRWMCDANTLDANEEVFTSKVCKSLGGEYLTTATMGQEYKLPH